MDLPFGVDEPVEPPASVMLPNGTGKIVLSRLTEPVFARTPAPSPTSIVCPDASLKST